VTPIKYHEAAEDELLTEIGYLELQAKGLGRHFYEEIRRAEHLMAQFPESARVAHTKRQGITRRRKFKSRLQYEMYPNITAI
jgi:plasmid stabilization system protein ParE